jgi:AbiV family abortive infection protein
LEDAKALLRSKRYGAAYYLAGYAIECALKACIAKKTRRYDFPPEPKEVNKLYTHDLQKLAEASGLITVLQEGPPKRQEYWTAVKDWNETSRYDPHAGKRAKDILLAIDDPRDGVLQCIKRYW